MLQISTGRGEEARRNFYAMDGWMDGCMDVCVCVCVCVRVPVFEVCANEG